MSIALLGVPIGYGVTTGYGAGITSYSPIANHKGIVYFKDDSQTSVGVAGTRKTSFSQQVPPSLASGNFLSRMRLIEPLAAITDVRPAVTMTVDVVVTTSVHATAAEKLALVDRARRFMNTTEFRSLAVDNVMVTIGDS